MSTWLDFSINSYIARHLHIATVRWLSSSIQHHQHHYDFQFNSLKQSNQVEKSPKNIPKCHHAVRQTLFFFLQYIFSDLPQLYEFCVSLLVYPGHIHNTHLSHSQDEVVLRIKKREALNDLIFALLFSPRFPLEFDKI